MHPGESRGRLIDTGVIRATDAVKVFAAQAESATVGDYLDLAYAMGKLAHAAERLEAVVRDATPLLTVSELKRFEIGGAKRSGC